MLSNADIIPEAAHHQFWNATGLVKGERVHHNALSSVGPHSHLLDIALSMNSSFQSLIDAKVAALASIADLHICHCLTQTNLNLSCGCVSCSNLDHPSWTNVSILSDFLIDFRND